MNVLVIKANNRPDGISTKMYDAFLENIEQNQDVNVETYDLFAEDTPYLSQDLFTAIGKIQEGAAMNEDEQRLMDAKQKAKDALSKADVVVVAFPLWNLTIPAKLQTFIDYVAEAGFTFKYTPEGLKPLMTDKQAILLNARGGNYSDPSMAPMEMSLNYMRNVLGGLFGMKITEEVIIEGHNANPDQAETIVNEGLEKVAQAAKNVAYQNV
ncbi:FMN-dependent NADH-azoreductase [Halobacillus sp. ACCC02827]|uniref:FMN-dependent NADH-azoreductase n=1 Tax=Bacillaceae TaxID=186817 RepID=UPI0002A4F52A|nr:MULTISPECIES: FMN-dependent NADH-azoreductase [Bacillaceae]ELK46732.1 FMN-dependent NADH-azoreductase [Halobacillus sp. BAB-2008]QHT48467.1 FMN-dependent NADH-azoreductase [Bacillus sp. SB49]WJE15704.1 FMN-dependent NADH-azoreductase [Halobacillus sp. ACCC02827]